MYDNATRTADKQAYERSKAAREAEVGRQQGFETQASDFWTETANKLSLPAMEATRGQQQQAFMDSFDAMSPAPEGMAIAGNDKASSEVQTEIARRVAGASAEARARVQNLAKLTSFDMAGADRSQSLNNNANLLQTINGLRQGSLGAAMQEGSIAGNQVFAPNTIIADILSGGGAALSGAGSPGGVLYGG